MRERENQRDKRERERERKCRSRSARQSSQQARVEEGKNRPARLRAPPSEWDGSGSEWAIVTRKTERDRVRMAK